MNWTCSSRLFLVLLLGACGGAPERDAREQPAAEPVPELTLNLPPPGCDCAREQRNYTFLEKGFNALEEGEYLESLRYFQNYRRIEKTPAATVEAGIAIAYLSILPDSPIFDREAARESYARIRKDMDPKLELHGEILLMRDSLETFIDMQRQIDRLGQNNSNLRAELEKREAAIRRLRDLTLGRQSEPGA